MGDALLTGVDRLLERVEELHRPIERDMEKEREGIRERFAREERERQRMSEERAGRTRAGRTRDR